MSTYHVTVANTAEQRQHAFDIRRTVFVLEQQVPEALEIDEYDHDTSTTHILCVDENGQPVAAARTRPYPNNTAKVERVAVLASHRGTGLGREVMGFIEAQAKQAAFRTLKLNAQLQAQGFYERLGYAAYGETFLDAGIEHIAMVKDIH